MSIGRRSLPALLLTALLAMAVLGAVVGGCGDFPDSPPLGPSPTVTPNSGPGVAANGETAEQAAKRLFPKAHQQALWAAESRKELQALQDVTPGDPVPLSRDYDVPGRLPVQWVLPDDMHAVSGNMFAAMWPIAMLKDGFLVPILKHGRVVSEYGVSLNGKSRWVVEEGAGAVPAGLLHSLEIASDAVEKALGPGTTVRPVMFVPSGLAFVVGNNDGREVAAYLSLVNWGKGVGGFDKWLPRVGQLFTPAQLKKLLTP